MVHGPLFPAALPCKARSSRALPSSRQRLLRSAGASITRIRCQARYCWYHFSCWTPLPDKPVHLFTKHNPTEVTDRSFLGRGLTVTFAVHKKQGKPIIATYW